MRRRWRGIGLIGASITAIALLAACAPAGISYTEAEALQAEISALGSRLEAVEREITVLADTTDSDEFAENAQATLSTIGSEVTAVLASLGDIEEALAPPAPIEGDPMEPLPAPGGDAF